MAEVAPFTGAWIEILLLLNKLIFCMSPPSRGRGLKFHKQALIHS